MAVRKGHLQSVAATPPEVARQREEAFQDWLKGAETAYLECRVGKHIIPGITDERSQKEVKSGVCLIESSCVRCGVTIRKQVGVENGFLVGQGSRGSYDYTQAPGYLLPPEAVGTGGAAMGKEHRGDVRLEILDRAFRAQGTTLAKEVAKDKKAAARKTRTRK